MDKSLVVRRRALQDLEDSYSLEWRSRYYALRSRFSAVVDRPDEVIGACQEILVRRDADTLRQALLQAPFQGGEKLLDTVEQLHAMTLAEFSIHDARYARQELERQHPELKSPRRRRKQKQRP